MPSALPAQRARPRAARLGGDGRRGHPDIFAQATGTEVWEQVDKVAAMLQPKFPAVATMLVDARHDLTAFASFPEEGNRRARRELATSSTNLTEVHDDASFSHSTRRGLRRTMLRCGQDARRPAGVERREAVRTGRVQPASAQDDSCLEIAWTGQHN